MDMAPTDPDAITLGRLVETGRRMIVGQTGTPIPHTYTEAYGGASTEGLFDILYAYTGALVQRNWGNVNSSRLGAMRYESIHEYKMVRTAGTPSSTEDFLSGEWNVGANSVTAMTTNRLFTPGEGDEDTNEETYYTGDSDEECE